MRNEALRQLEVLETEERGNQQQRQSSFQTTDFLCWKVVLAHHLGSWKPDEEDPGDAEARALNYESQFHYLEALFNSALKPLVYISAKSRRSKSSSSSEAYIAVFGKRLGESGSGWARNSDTLEYPYSRGSFQNTTVQGQVTGKGLDLGIVDDPLKGRAEANSKPIRDKVWDWLIDDFLTRFSETAGLIMIMTRWHVDDPVGRLPKRLPDATILRYPAVAEEHGKNRRKGEALFPEHKSLAFLMRQKRAMTQASWESEYQQNPIVSGGGVIPIEKLRVLPFFDKGQIKRSVRYIDKPSTDSGGAYTAAVLMHQMFDGTYVISHIARGQWGALERERKIKILVDADARLYKNYEIGIEQEPGSAGKESAEATIRNLAGKRVFADRVTGSKETRAEPFVAQCQNDNMRLVAGEWVHALYDEAEAWPASKHKDQIDACSGAFNRLVQGYG